ncbi:MAG TPA: hypothetical protein DCR60_09330, partial [Psychrobacter sp.]|nr:hypothetical protein [Psychrobacter sp.]
MNTISQPTHSQKSPKVATLTALAAACAMMLSAPVNAAEVDASATASISVPSAIDSSKRVIRLARPNAAVSATQAATTVQPEVATSTAAQVSAQANINANQQSNAQVT